MKGKRKILLAEDDPNLGFLLQTFLEKKDFEVKWVQDGDEGLKELVSNSYDLCLLDVMMPKKDGFSLAKDIQQSNLKVPIIFLTAKSMEEDTLKGFKLGADDYLTKPVSMEILIARIEAVLRRTQLGSKGVKDISQEIKIGQYQYFPEKSRLIIGDSQQKFTPKENQLVKLLVENMNQTISRSFALKLIWGNDTYFNARSMDVYMTKLRKMFKDDPKVQIINLHGEGFKLLVEE